MSRLAVHGMEGIWRWLKRARSDAQQAGRVQTRPFYTRGLLTVVLAWPHPSQYLEAALA